jgi:hypothetical protein
MCTCIQGKVILDYFKVLERTKGHLRGKGAPEGSKTRDREILELTPLPRYSELGDMNCMLRSVKNHKKEHASIKK